MSQPVNRRGLSPEALDVLLSPGFAIPADGTFKVGDETNVLTVKKANEALRFIKLFKGDPRGPAAEKTLNDWIGKQKPAGKEAAERPKFRDKPYRMPAVHNSQTDRRGVLVDTSPLFHEGGRALPFGVVSVLYQKIPATSGSGKTPGSAEIQQIIITRTEPTKEEAAKHEDRLKAKAKAKANKAKRA